MEKTLTEEEMRMFHSESADELLRSWGFDPTRGIMVHQTADRSTVMLYQDDNETP